MSDLLLTNPIGYDGDDEDVRRVRPRYDHTSARSTGDEWRDHWRTPREFVRVVEDVLQVSFVLDAAATASSAVCQTWLGPSGEYEDALADGAMLGGFRRAVGLLATTGQRPTRPAAIWLNPPYSQLTPREWVARAIEVGMDVPIACLVPCRPCSAWARRLLCGASDLLIPDSRLSFLVPLDAPEGAVTSEGAPGDTWVVVRRPQWSGSPTVRYVPLVPQGVLL